MRGMTAALLFLTAFVAPRAHAQTDLPHVRPGLSIGPRAMYFIPKGADAESGKLYGGAQVRLHLGEVIALEGSADYRRQRFGPGGSTRVDIFPVQASLLAYLFPKSPITPFVLGGGGWYFTNVEGPSGFNETQNRFGPHVGAGLQLFLNRRLSIDATWRYAWVEDIRSRGDNRLERDYNDQGHMITGALNFHF